MPPSQLKRLRGSLREKGILGPQKSNKQKRQASNKGASAQNRIDRDGALQSIREQFNPFEIRPAERQKYAVANPRTTAAVKRPGISKELGEENRRKTLLVEIQRRKKVGGITDRRFGENNPTMNPEEKALQRFVRERERGGKKNAIFDLEDPEDDGELTHFGQSLSFDTIERPDDFHGCDLSGTESDLGDEEHISRPVKRRRISESDMDDNKSGSLISEANHRPKSKKEVMEEVIAKSKQMKYERQKAREDDDDLRAELDKDLPDLYAMLRGRPHQKVAQSPEVEVQLNGNEFLDPDRLALLEGKDRSKADKEYDQRLRQMAIDKRAKPTVPTLTEEEGLARQAHKLKQLEEKRLRRMRGESEGSESALADADPVSEKLVGGEDEEIDAFGLGPGLAAEAQRPPLEVEDEDEFVIEDDLIASGSDLSVVEDNQSESSISSIPDDEDDEFVTGLLSADDARREDFSALTTEATHEHNNGDDVAFVYKCPQTHQELLQITQKATQENLPVIIQRIRALYHPKLAAENKAKLARFASILVEHIVHLSEKAEKPSFTILEALIRHVHSLAKGSAEEVGRAFRSHLRAIHETRPNRLTPGDLIIFTAIGSIFPTSDHFHQIVTPAQLCMTRYLSQSVPKTVQELSIGTYVCTLCLQYQQLAERYVPEALNYILNAIPVLVPASKKKGLSTYSTRKLPEDLRLQPSEHADGLVSRGLSFNDTILTPVEGQRCEELKQALLRTHITLAKTTAHLWSSKSAFCEIIHPVYQALRRVGSKAHSATVPRDIRKQAQAASQEIYLLLKQSLENRKPLRLHNHRPLAIKTSVPKFEESYNPDRHYDPDPDRAALSKLKAEHKKERKGALRELRKDASFMARQDLREKKEKDAAYDKKFKRLVAEIQGEEGHEGKVYEKEKRLRKGKK